MAISGLHDSYYYYFMIVSVWLLSVHHMCAKRAMDPLELEQMVVTCHVRVWKRSQCS